jgi:hypothetical protein
MLTHALALLLLLAPAGGEAGGAAPPPAPAPEAPAAASTTREPLREIGHVHALSVFCQAFVKHFNDSAHSLLDNDQTLTFVDFTMSTLESHFKAKGGELLLYDDRVHLMHYTGDVIKSTATLQSDINDLRKSADLAKDPEQAKEARATAADLQEALDHQHQMALDSLGVIHAMIDLATGFTTSVSVQVHPGGPPTIGAPEVAGPAASTDYTGGTAANMDYTQTTPAERRDVRSYLRFNKQFNKISEVESDAVLHAQNVANRC